MQIRQPGALAIGVGALLFAIVACSDDPLGAGSLTEDPLASVSGETIVSNGFGTLRLRCEGRTGRSKISVDGNNLASGTYSARVTSGANQATAPTMTTIGDEVEFDFDSDPGDIAEGATAIGANFIDTSSTPHVLAQIIDAGGATLISAGGDCSSRTGRDDDDEDDDDGDNDEDDETDDDDDGEATFVSATGTLDLKCEARTVRGRSKVSVDGENLAQGMYTARISSGANTVSSEPLATQGDEVEFDFDSDPGDIAQGATAIAGNFIDTSSSPQVSAEIVAADGTVVVSGGTDCRVRND